MFSSTPGGKIGETETLTSKSSKISSTLSSSSSSSKSIEQPFIIPINAAKSNIQLSTPTETMLKEIQIRLDKLNINGIKNQIQTITKGKSEINKLEEQFKMSPDSIEKPLATVNAISNNFVSRKNYYSKPSFPDVQLEDRNYQLAANYDGSSFYEWNIDGMSEHQIINLLHAMMMAANAYRIKTSNSDFHAAGALVIGFTGLLKG